MELKQLRCSELTFSINAILAWLIAMSSVFSGFFLWGLVKKHKKSKEKEKSSRGGKGENAAVFPTRSPPLEEPQPPPLSTYVPLESWNVHVNNESPFDPESDYAQVLSEAQKFASQAKVSAQAEATACPRLSRMHSFKPREREIKTSAKDNADVKPPKKSKSSWKNMKEALFLHRSKKAGDGNYSASSPAAQLRSQRPLKRSVSGPLASCSYSSTRKGSHGGHGYSGPLYSVGSRPEPANVKYSRSGIRSGSATPERGCQLESPYELLKSSARQLYEPEPLYTA